MNSSQIHPTAIISPQAVLGDNVTIGPYTVIEEHVVIGSNCKIGPHAHILGHTTIGAGTVIHAGAVLGDLPQDLHFKDCVSYTEIGEHCTIREYVTIHRGTNPESKTSIGNEVMLMAFCHVGHNCRLGNNVIIANNTLLAGHVEIQDRAFLSGAIAVHQFCRVGTLAMVGGGNIILQDVPPYCLVQLGKIQSTNKVGLRRAGISRESQEALRQAVKIFFLEGMSRPNAIEKIRTELGEVPEIQNFVNFLESTKRGILHGRHSSQT